MGWCDEALERLKNGQVAKIRPKGSSMSGKVENNELVTVAPLTKPLKVGDIVLVKVKGVIYLHLIKDINKDRYLIGNNRGGTNGWVKVDAIYGILIRIQPPSTPDPYRPPAPDSSDTALTETPNE
jgi:hypothetical protein